LTPDEYGSFLRTEFSGWKDVEEKKIEKEYKFKNFKDALAIDFPLRGVFEILLRLGV